VNQNCLNLITRASASSITGKGNQLNWYLPCNVYNQFGTSGVNLTGYESSNNCHVSLRSRQLLKNLKREGQVFYSWDQVKDKSRNLAVFES
jgi:chitin synthase